MDDKNLKEWSNKIWAVVEYDPSRAVEVMKQFMEELSRLSDSK